MCLLLSSRVACIKLKQISSSSSNSSEIAFLKDSDEESKEERMILFYAAVGVPILTLLLRVATLKNGWNPIYSIFCMLDDRLIR